MTNLPGTKELKDLQDFKKPYCVSIFVPFSAPTGGTNPNRIELKRLVAEAETALLSAGAAPEAIKKTLRSARTLEKDLDFWLTHRNSLLLFMHPEMFRMYQIHGLVVPSAFTIGKGFDLKLLQTAVRDNQEYYLLALSHKNVRLYKGDHYQLKALQPKNFPTNMKEALNIDEYPSWRETHTIAPVSRGKGSEGYHSQYNVRQTDKLMLREFFRLLDKRLHSYLKHKHAPLLIAGVGYLLPMYRQINTYPYLLGDDLRGNLERTNTDVIHERAWPLISKQAAPTIAVK